MAKAKQKESNLTYSGFEYDQELARVSIKVVPALQALIANQHELMEIAEKYRPDDMIFLEAHRADLNIIENTIAQAFKSYSTRKEETRRRREERKEERNNTPPSREEVPFGMDSAGPSGGEPGYPGYDHEPLRDAEAALDEMAAALSPGLPSSKLAPRKPPTAAESAPDVRRIAIGASIKALSGILGRELTEEEMVAIENQVDTYL
ncbi:MAG: hypothetical protein HPY50_00050 [Firmicutes bacterium]|nr:hypothetical protein [Bacillota bacterium]